MKNRIDTTDGERAERPTSKQLEILAALDRKIERLRTEIILQSAAK